MAKPGAADRKDSRLQASLRPPTRRRRALRILGMSLAAVLFCGFLNFHWWEEDSRQLRQSMYVANRDGAKSLDDWVRKQIIIVELSDSTFNSLNLPPPVIPRSYHARLIQQLQRAGAKVIAFDLMFHTSKPEDKQFAAAAKNYGKVVWGCLFENYGSSDQKLVEPNPELLQAVPYFGHLQVPLDLRNTKAERMQPVLKQSFGGEDNIEAFCVQVARLAKGQEHRPLVKTPTGWRIGSLALPIDNDGETNDSFKIKYYGEDARTSNTANPGATRTEHTFFKAPYEDVLQGVATDSFYGKNHIFKDKIVLVGNTTTAANDDVDTPVGRMWGVEVHANAVASLLVGSFFEDASPATNLLALFVPALIICLLGLFVRLIWITPLSVLVSGSYVALNVWLYFQFQYALNLVTPLIAVGAVTLIVLVERGAVEQREKNRVSALLQRHLSPQIATYVMENPDVLHTRRVCATVLFSDIRGFTSLSEKLSPEEVVVRLNEYFQSMTTAVFKHNGAVDKYIGDAIMALFNTPIADADHIKQAVATAIDMQTALLELQAKWKREGLPPIDIGIGINTGDMVVGYMGARERLDFTVIGDAVNTASRVEGMNKELGTRILVTDSTFAGVRDHVEARGPHHIHVKGKDEEVVVYEIVGWKRVATLNSARD